jgi:hypothetical protein
MDVHELNDIAMCDLNHRGATTSNGVALDPRPW